MSREVETVAKYCKHEDCIYRRYLGCGTPICFYAVIMNESRKCRISECDKYKKGTKRPRTLTECIKWEIEYE